MAIHPIDLSVVYTQMDNVAKFNASQNQLAQAMNHASVEKGAMDNLEKSKTVQETAKNETVSTKIRNNGGSGGGGGYYGSGKKKRGQGDDAEGENTQEEIRDPRLGQHIDITR